MRETELAELDVCGRNSIPYFSGNGEQVSIDRIEPSWFERAAATRNPAFIATLSKSSPRKAIPAIVYIATMRAKLGTEIDQIASKRAKVPIHAHHNAFGVVCAALGYVISRFVF